MESLFLSLGTAIEKDRSSYTIEVLHVDLGILSSPIDSDFIVCLRIYRGKSSSMNAGACQFIN